MLVEFGYHVHCILKMIIKCHKSLLKKKFSVNGVMGGGGAVIRKMSKEAVKVGGRLTRVYLVVYVVK